MHECRRLQGLIEATAAHGGTGKATQLCVDLRKQQIGGCSIALGSLLQQQSHVGFLRRFIRRHAGKSTRMAFEKGGQNARA